MGIKIKDGRVKGAKKESTFGTAKKPFKGKSSNRKGNVKNSFSDSSIKPKYSAKNKKLITVEDSAYLKWLKSLSVVCFCCGKQNGIEWHHVKQTSSDKKNHKRLIPLCGIICHRLGTVLSAHSTPKKFRAIFSIEKQNAHADEFYKKYEKEMLCKV